MKAYSLEIPGRVHDCSEDAYYQREITAFDGIVWGLYLVADGCSGYSGRSASGKVVKTIGMFVEDNLISSKSDPGEILKQGVIHANEFVSKGHQRTTLEALLLSTEQGFLVHLGDSRAYALGSEMKQLTKDERGYGDDGPGNYLGEEYVNSRKIADRLNLQILYQAAAERPPYFIAMTDGFLGRVMEDELQEVFKALLRDEDPEVLLEKMAAIYASPRKMILSQSIQDLRLYFVRGVDNFPFTEEESIEEVGPRVLQAYVHRSHPQLVQKIDLGNGLAQLKADDATIMVIDTQDRGKALREEWKKLREEHPRLEEKLKGAEQGLRKEREERLRYQQLYEQEVQKNADLVQEKDSDIEKGIKAVRRWLDWYEKVKQDIQKKILK